MIKILKKIATAFKQARKFLEILFPQRGFIDIDLKSYETLTIIKFIELIDRKIGPTIPEQGLTISISPPVKQHFFNYQLLLDVWDKSNQNPTGDILWHIVPSATNIRPPSHVKKYEDNFYEMTNNTLNLASSIYSDIKGYFNLENRYHITSFTDTLDEILKNINEHSNCSIFRILFMIYQDKLEIEVWDNGEGIKATLTKNDPKNQSSIKRNIINRKKYLGLKNQDSSVSIKNAFQDGVSGTDLTKISFNSGNGLYSILDSWIMPYNGEIVVAS